MTRNSCILYSDLLWKLGGYPILTNARRNWQSAFFRADCGVTCLALTMLSMLSRGLNDKLEQSNELVV